MRAVVLDFFGTLTDPAAEWRRREVYDATAQALRVDPERFWQQVSSSFSQRATGSYGGTADTLRAVRERCGGDRDGPPIDFDAAARAHRRASEVLRAPRPGALDVLAALRARGFRLALLSDCSSELCEVWDQTPYAPLLDATVFSWAVGYRKPDPRGFRRAAELVGCLPSQCWYVGDGGSREMTGAAAVGMRPVLVTNTAFPGHGGLRDDPDAFVPDDCVPDIRDVLDVVGLPG